MSAALEGLDILVFTGGIGANDASIRQAIGGRLEWLNNEPEIGVIPANEEAMIATHTLRLLNRANQDA